MKWKWPVACLMVGMVGFLAGRLTTHSGKAAAGVPADLGINRGHAVPTDAQVAGDSEEIPRQKPSHRDRPPGEQEPRVSIPLKAVTEILKESQFVYGDFEVINRKMPDALTILGVSPSDKKAALRVMDESRKRLFEEEKKHVRVSRADETGITLDQSAMEAPSRAVVDETQKGLRENLPAEVAEALISSIDWDRYYFNTTKSTSFRISRSAGGSLGATTVSGTGSMSSGLRPGEHPDDGTPISAEEVFDKRWAPFLHGKTLLPVNK